MKELICNNALFGVVLTAALWQFALFVQKKLKSPLANPLLISIVLGISILLVFDIPLEWYQKGASAIDLMMLPATAALGLSIWRQRKVLLNNFWPVVLGCCAGCAANAVTVIGLSYILKLDEVLHYSLMPRSVTTPIAVALSTQGGGLPAITVAAVLLTGVVGAVFAPMWVKLFGLKDESVASGVAIGSASHVLGTTTAMKMGEVEGAMSSVAIGVSGLLTVALAVFW